jgi:hypothetical protein
LVYYGRQRLSIHVFIQPATGRTWIARPLVPHHPKIQIITIRELLAGMKPDRPPPLGRHLEL